jgi:DNA-binding IclR family transcriptional regulator
MGSKYKKNPSEGNKYYEVGSLAKGFRILETITREGGLTVTEIARKISLNRSTTNRFVLTLADLGFIAVDENGKYTLTLKLFELAQQNDVLNTVTLLARKYMLELRNLHENTVYFTQLEDRDIITLEVVQGSELIRADGKPGSKGPAHVQASGKAIMAFVPGQRIADYFATDALEMYTPNSITDPRTLKAELEKVRRDGYALDNEEWAMGIRGVAVPLVGTDGKSAYGISISGHSLIFTKEKALSAVNDLMRARNMLADELGWTLHPEIPGRDKK